MLNISETVQDTHT